MTFCSLEPKLFPVRRCVEIKCTNTCEWKSCFANTSVSRAHALHRTSSSLDQQVSHVTLQLQYFGAKKIFGLSFPVPPLLSSSQPSVLSSFLPCLFTALLPLTFLCSSSFDSWMMSAQMLMPKSVLVTAEGLQQGYCFRVMPHSQLSTTGSCSMFTSFRYLNDLKC